MQKVHVAKNCWKTIPSQDSPKAFLSIALPFFHYTITINLLLNLCNCHNNKFVTDFKQTASFLTLFSCSNIFFYSSTVITLTDQFLLFVVPPSHFVRSSHFPIHLVELWSSAYYNPFCRTLLSNTHYTLSPSLVALCNSSTFIFCNPLCRDL